MIVIKEKSKNSKIFIQRQNIINTPSSNNNVELSIPTVFINWDGTYDGDMQKVLDAYRNGENYNVYVRNENHIYYATQIIDATTHISIYIFRIHNSRVQRVQFMYILPNFTFDKRSETFASTPVNNLTSTSTTLPLSANMGKELNSKIAALSAKIDKINSILNQLQEQELFDESF